MSGHPPRGRRCINIYGGQRALAIAGSCPQADETEPLNNLHATVTCALASPISGQPRSTYLRIMWPDTKKHSRITQVLPITGELKRVAANGRPASAPVGTTDVSAVPP